MKKLILTALFAFASSESFAELGSRPVTIDYPMCVGQNGVGFMCYPDPVTAIGFCQTSGYKSGDISTITEIDPMPTNRFDGRNWTLVNETKLAIGSVICY
jgi:hypothetical protein